MILYTDTYGCSWDGVETYPARGDIIQGRMQSFVVPR